MVGTVHRVFQPWACTSLLLSMQRFFSLQFFIFLLIIFAAEVAAGIWGLSKQEKVDNVHTSRMLEMLCLSCFLLIFSLCLTQIVSDVQTFYTETFNNYKATKQDGLKETLRLIHFGVSF